MRYPRKQLVWSGWFLMLMLATNYERILAFYTPAQLIGSGIFLIGVHVLVLEILWQVSQRMPIDPATARSPWKNYLLDTLELALRTVPVCLLYVGYFTVEEFYERSPAYAVELETRCQQGESRSCNELIEQAKSDQDFRRAASLAEDRCLQDYVSCNDAAYYLSQVPDATDSERARALKLVYRALESDDSNPVFLDTYAAVLFMNGQADVARKEQVRAILALQKRFSTAQIRQRLTRFERRFVHYQSRQPASACDDPLSKR